MIHNANTQHASVQTNNTANSVTIKLSYPFNFDGKEYKEVTVRNPKLRDLRLLDEDDKEVAKSITLGASLTGLPPLALEEISGFDWSEIQKVIADFLQKAPSITKK